MSSNAIPPEILLVAASPLTRKSIERLLSADFKMVHASDAGEAWELLQQQQSQISLLVCDLELSIDQDALLERVRKAHNKSIASLPVLLLVGENIDEQQRDQAFGAGASDFINMPFSKSELTTRVRLHANMFQLYNPERDFDSGGRDTSIDLLKSLMQERHFRERLEQEVSFSRRHKSFVSVCLLQIDSRDEHLEQLGKKVANAINRAVARIISKKIRREDSYAYFGDGTYALIYPATNGVGASTATRRLLEKVGKTRIKHGDEAIPVTLSAGLFSALPVDHQSADDIMRILHSRLESAQHKGGNQLVSSKTEQEQAELSIEQALNMISYQRTDGLEKQVPQLLDALMPLLEFAKQYNQVELESVIAELGDVSW